MWNWHITCTYLVVIICPNTASNSPCILFLFLKPPDVDIVDLAPILAKNQIHH